MKNLFVITRLRLRPNNMESMKSWLTEWQLFLAKHANVSSIDILALTEENVCWLESWSSREQFDKFNREHMIFSDFTNRLTGMSYPDMDRDIYKKVR